MTSGRYDAVIIVSHSQGTVITADVLRFVHHEASLCGGMKAYDPELARLDHTQGDLPVTPFTKPARTKVPARRPSCDGARAMGRT